MFVAGKNWEPPRITGSLRGKQVELSSYTTGSGKSRKTWAAISVMPTQAVALTFSISRQGFLTKLQTLFGAREITVGDRAFDDRWFIQTNKPDFFQAALLPELRAKIDAAASGGARGEFKLQDGAVRYAEQGGFTDERCARYEALLPLLCDLADVAEVEASLPPLG